MEQKLNMDVFTIFNRLEPADLVAVHDFQIRQNGTFAYVPESIIGQTAGGVALGDFPILVGRPIISQLDILDMLQSLNCVCGASKARGRSHCRDCYLTLSPEKQKSLYRRFRSGYEESFLESLLLLIDAGRTDVDKILAAVPKPKTP